MAKRKIAKYMHKDLVVKLESNQRDDVLREFVRIVYQSGRIEDEEEFFQAILEREKIVSTGIGMGVAIPHAKLSSFNQFFIAIGILTTPVEWNSLDKFPVQLIFMIGGPDDKQTEYLQILSGLTHTIRDEKKRMQLFMRTNPSSIIEIFEEM